MKQCMDGRVAKESGLAHQAGLLERVKVHRVPDIVDGRATETDK